MSKLVVEVSEECLIQLRHVALDRRVKAPEVAADILEKFASKKKTNKFDSNEAHSG